MAKLRTKAEPQTAPSGSLTKALLAIYIDGFLATEQSALKWQYGLLLVVALAVAGMFVYGFEAGFSSADKFGTALTTVVGGKPFYDVLGRREALQQVRNHHDLLIRFSERDAEWPAVAELLTKYVKARLEGVEKS